MKTNGISNQQITHLQHQNAQLQKDLKESNDRIRSLLNGNNSNSNDSSNASNDITIYQEMIRQQQLQMQQLMR